MFLDTEVAGADCRLFTAESVSVGHPDKICDQISDAILDACLLEDPDSRVAIETAIKGHTLCLLGEITSTAEIDFIGIAKNVLSDIGHDEQRWGVDINSLKFVQGISQQAPEIASGVDGEETGAGDQGMMFGFACDETDVFMPAPIHLAHQLMIRHKELRALPRGAVLGPDAKSQVTLRYQDGRPVAIDTVVLSTQHAKGVPVEEIRRLVRDALLEPILGDALSNDVKIWINPAGSFETGGPVADAGLTGRKIIVDTYGGYAHHGGGAFSGKDGTKVDRSGAYAARQLAKDVVSRGWAQSCEVRVAYAIGVARPVAIDFEFSGTDNGADIADRYRQFGIDLYELLKPASIIERLDLRRPQFRETAAFGHFGRSGFGWEKGL